MTRHSSNELPHMDLAYMRCEAQWRKTYPAGRECYVCGTALSKYNPEATCYAHRPEPDFLRYHGCSFAVCNECGVVMEHGGRVKVERTCTECRKEAGHE